MPAISKARALDRRSNGWRRPLLGVDPIAVKTAMELARAALAAVDCRSSTAGARFAPRVGDRCLSRSSGGRVHRGVRVVIEVVVSGASETRSSRRRCDCECRGPPLVGAIVREAGYGRRRHWACRDGKAEWRDRDERGRRTRPDMCSSRRHHDASPSTTPNARLGWCAAAWWQRRVST